MESMMPKRLKIGLLMTIGASTLVLSLSGRWTDPWIWMYCATWAATVGYGLLGIDDDLARERFDPPSRGADAVALVFVRLLGLAHLVVGALDAGRWHLTAPVPSALRAAALTGMGLSAMLIYRSMRENHYFSAVVRVQEERGHRVIDTGPYSVVRHPGYVGMIGALPLSGLALGSWVSFGIALVYSALILRRVMFEDAFLLRNLPGYAEYTRRVTRRLIPGTW
jgi:protein-S-isoprenylcysteine O-methyltransferase Ste14